MPSRRAVIAGAGVAFCGCCLASPTSIPDAGRHRLRGVRTVDIHAHCFVPEALGLLEPARRDAMLRPAFGATAVDTLLAADGDGPARRLARMDAQGIDTEVLSINPFWYGEDRALSAEITSVQNARLAALCAASGGRFAGLASLSLDSPELAAEQLKHATTVLGLKGAAIGGHVAGVNFSDRRFDTVWRTAEALGAPLLIHPADLRISELDRRLAGNGALANAIGNPFGTTVALAHLIFEGTFDRFPALKVCAVHGGGYLPSYAARTDHICRVAAAQCDPTVRLAKAPSEYLRQIFYDSLVFTSEALRHLIAEVGVGQVMMGTDTPYPWQDRPVQHVLSTPGLSPAERRDILGGNAIRLFRL